ncbi:Fic family protein [Pseudomonas sp. PSE14]|uniref:Fic family protein n=1 Tax=Pseudomonas sp. PSE14 TaxID=3016341 RepID=UPI0023D848B4|nr:Fic family protein [Pseudomonas sp. PSE14]WEJ73699.1 Fic family protein [Pseudomonas sp. PSE14]
MSIYQPPLTLTPAMFSLVAELAERIGRLAAGQERSLTPQLRRGNRIRTIQASLAIENNTLSVEQVTALLEGRRVLGLPREIQEVRNAFRAYEQLPQWRADSVADLLAAHGCLLEGLIDEAGRFRQGGVGIYREQMLLHMPPPASRVPLLVEQLLGWLGRTDWHPLIASCVFHYEFEFIHPFSDGNGRMGRLWQTLLLGRWNPVLAYLPVETVIHARQASYYAALAESDRQAEATPFVLFMLQALLSAVDEVAVAGEADSRSDLVSDPVSDPVDGEIEPSVRRLLSLFQPGDVLKIGDMMGRLSLSHRTSFRNNYLNPALTAGWLEMTQPDSPRSPTQGYRLTARGRRLLAATGV